VRVPVTEGVRDGVGVRVGVPVPVRERVGVPVGVLLQRKRKRASKQKDADGAARWHAAYRQETAVSCSRPRRC